MSFAHLEWLYVLPIFFLLAVFSILYRRKQFRKNLEKCFKRPQNMTLVQGFSKQRFWAKRILFFAAIALCIIALAGPHWDYIWQENTRKTMDVLFILDTSKSMLAEDMRPNRLERTKLALIDFVQGLEDTRVGLIAFAGNAFVQCPLTLDTVTFERIVRTITTDTIPEPGTDIAAALKLAKNALRPESTHKHCILLTDGEDLEAAGIQAAKALVQAGVVIHTVGIGSEEGELIPIENASGHKEYLKDENGKLVRTRLDTLTLKAIAEATGGLYTPLGNAAQGLLHIRQALLSQIPKEERISTLQKRPIERFQWPLLLAIVLFVLEMTIRERKGYRRKRAANVFWASCALLLSSGPAGEASLIGEATKAYNKKQFERAAVGFEQALEKDPNNPELAYSLGNSEYKQQHFKSAQAYYEKALKTEDIKLQQDTYYNLGNTCYQQGLSSIPLDIEEAKKQFESALHHYKTALELNPKDHQALQNSQLTQAVLEQIKKEEQTTHPKGEGENKPSSQTPKEKDPESEFEKRESGEKMEDPQGAQRGEEDKENPNSLDKNPKKEQSSALEADKEEEKTESKGERTGTSAQEETQEQEASAGVLTEEEAKALLQEVGNNEHILGAYGTSPSAPKQKRNNQKKAW